MNGLNGILIPTFVNRRAYWLRLLVLLPASFILSLIQVEEIYAGADIPGLNLLYFAILGAIFTTIIGRATEIGASWFSQLALFSILLSFAGPFLIAEAFQRHPEWRIFSGDNPNLLENLFFLCSAPFDAIILMAGFLKGDPNRWIARLTRRIERAPFQARFYCRRGRACAVLGRMREAIADYEKAARLRPTNQRIARILSDLKYGDWSGGHI